MQADQPGRPIHTIIHTVSHTYRTYNHTEIIKANSQTNIHTYIQADIEPYIQATTQC